MQTFDNFYKRYDKYMIIILSTFAAKSNHTIQNNGNNLSSV